MAFRSEDERDLFRSRERKKSHITAVRRGPGGPSRAGVGRLQIGHPQASCKLRVRTQRAPPYALPVMEHNRRLEAEEAARLAARALEAASKAVEELHAQVEALLCAHIMYNMKLD